MLDRDIHKIVRLLTREVQQWELPIVSRMAERKSTPFLILISTVLSSRTTDEVTAAASERLFSLAATPEKMLELSDETVLKAIYPVGFYHTKVKAIREICRELIERFHSRVPKTIDELLTLRRVGRKTANLVLSLGFGGDGICVDTHVTEFRIGSVTSKRAHLHKRKPS